MAEYTQQIEDIIFRLQLSYKDSLEIEEIANELREYNKSILIFLKKNNESVKYYQKQAEELLGQLHKVEDEYEDLVKKQKIIAELNIEDQLFSTFSNSMYNKEENYTGAAPNVVFNNQNFKLRRQSNSYGQSQEFVFPDQKKIQNKQSIRYSETDEMQQDNQNVSQFEYKQVVNRNKQLEQENEKLQQEKLTLYKNYQNIEIDLQITKDKQSKVTQDLQNVKGQYANSEQIKNQLIEKALQQEQSLQENQDVINNLKKKIKKLEESNMKFQIDLEETLHKYLKTVDERDALQTIYLETQDEMQNLEQKFEYEKKHQPQFLDVSQLFQNVTGQLTPRKSHIMLFDNNENKYIKVKLDNLDEQEQMPAECELYRIQTEQNQGNTNENLLNNKPSYQKQPQQNTLFNELKDFEKVSFQFNKFQPFENKTPRLNELYSNISSKSPDREFIERQLSNLAENKRQDLISVQNTQFDDIVITDSENQDQQQSKKIIDDTLFNMENQIDDRDKCQLSTATTKNTINFRNEYLRHRAHNYIKYKDVNMNKGWRAECVQKCTIF